MLGITVGAAYMVMNHSGQNRLAKKQEAVPVQMQQETESPDETQEQLEAGSIRYQGKVYTYKKDIQNRLAKKQEAVPVQMQQETESPDETQEQLEAGSIRYQGKVYTYKKDILTFLFMGIDKTGAGSDAAGNGKSG